ncbi:MAG: hypothetical protein Q4F34_05675 [Prevotellaceae bacterium]|nr:hypothetical protein [Prevotellaceae bacterium]
MKRITIGFFIVACLSSCATSNYSAQIPRQDEPVNPDAQKPLPDDGLAGMVRRIVSR